MKFIEEKHVELSNSFQFLNLKNIFLNFSRELIFAVLWSEIFSRVQIFAILLKNREKSENQFSRKLVTFL